MTIHTLIIIEIMWIKRLNLEEVDNKLKYLRCWSQNYNRWDVITISIISYQHIIHNHYLIIWIIIIIVIILIITCYQHHLKYCHTWDDNGDNKKPHNQHNDVLMRTKIMIEMMLMNVDYKSNKLRWYNHTRDDAERLIT